MGPVAGQATEGQEREDMVGPTEGMEVALQPEAREVPGRDPQLIIWVSHILVAALEVVIIPALMQEARQVAEGTAAQSGPMEVTVLTVPEVEAEAVEATVPPSQTVGTVVRGLR